MLDLNIGEGEACRALAHWDVGELLGFPGERGGTANPAVVVDAAAGRFFLKRRNPRYSAPEMLRHDHALMEHLAAKGLCTPLALRSKQGQRWVSLADGVYELYPYMPGAPHDPTSEAQIAEAGRALALFHAATEDFAPPAGKEWPRYHAPSLTIEALKWALDELAGRDQPTPAGRSPEQAQAEVQRLLQVAEELAASFTDADYASCEQVTVHGDWHPANVKYEGDRVCGIFDLDWATRQPRLVDIADGVMFFAGARGSPLDATDIRSLTQPFTLRPDRTRAFLEGYRSAARREAAELAALPRFMLARWLWCRADPMRRKIPRHEAIDYLLDGIWGPLDALRETDSGHSTFA
jgi:Ser/Thr protein kinase RdoA (MazF antagonist)